MKFLLLAFFAFVTPLARADVVDVHNARGKVVVRLSEPAVVAALWKFAAGSEANYLEFTDPVSLPGDRIVYVFKRDEKPYATFGVMFRDDLVSRRTADTDTFPGQLGKNSPLTEYTIELLEHGTIPVALILQDSETLEALKKSRRNEK